MVIGGTLAYFTDQTEVADNTFTMGNVKIQLIEQERQKDQNGDFTTTLQKFTPGKILLPIVGSAQEGEDSLGLPTAKNYVDKIIDVKNTGTQDAYVRVLLAFPEKMDAETAAEMMMHWNYIEEGYGWTAAGLTEQVTVDGETYNLYSFTYEPVLEDGQTTTSHAIIGVYLDSRVNATVDNGQLTYSMKNSAGQVVEATYPEDGGPIIYAVAQAVQAEGFTSAAAAFEAAGMPVTGFWDDVTP